MAQQTQIEDLYSKSSNQDKRLAVLESTVLSHIKGCDKMNEAMMKKLDSIESKLSARQKWLLSVVTSLLIACIIYIIKTL